MMRKKFPLYADYRTKLALLTDTQMGILFRGILADRNGEAVSFTEPVLRMAWAFIKDDFNAFDSMYEETVKERKKAARARWDANDANASKCISEMQVHHGDANDADIVTDTDSVTETAYNISPYIGGAGE